MRSIPKSLPIHSNHRTKERQMKMSSWCLGAVGCERKQFSVYQAVLSGLQTSSRDAPSQSPAQVQHSQHRAALLPLLMTKLPTPATSGHAQWNPGKALYTFNPHYHRLPFAIWACSWWFNHFIFTWKNGMNLTQANKQPLMPSIPELTTALCPWGNRAANGSPLRGAKHFINKPNVFTGALPFFKLMVHNIPRQSCTPALHNSLLLPSHLSTKSIL